MSKDSDYMHNKVNDCKSPRYHVIELGHFETSPRIRDTIFAEKSGSKMGKKFLE